MKSVREAEVKGKKVFLRADFNIPIENGKIGDNNRIKAVIPTIKYLLEKKARIIIGTHLGRPEGKVNTKYSTVPVARELAHLLNMEVEATDHVVSSIVDEKISKMQEGEIIVLGNLRFHPEEEANEKSFAKKLASYADIYVNDAFAVSHRANASVEAITEYLPSYAGLLLESEMTSLNLLLDNPEHPFVLVIGGSKIKDKAGTLNFLAEKADQVLIGGAVANTFLAARGEEMGKSLVDSEMFETCKQIMEKFGPKIHLPIDFEKEVVDGGFSCMDIGPRTRDDFRSVVADAKCVFWNGNMGYTENERFRKGTEEIAEAMIKNTYTTVIAGGDTVGFIDKFDLHDGISFISTGGGAAMQYLAGEELPGIAALNREQASKLVS